MVTRTLVPKAGISWIDPRLWIPLRLCLSHLSYILLAQSSEMGNCAINQFISKMGPLFCGSNLAFCLYSFLRWVRFLLCLLGPSATARHGFDT